MLHKDLCAHIYRIQHKGWWLYPFSASSAFLFAFLWRFSFRFFRFSRRFFCCRFLSSSLFFLSLLFLLRAASESDDSSLDDDESDSESLLPSLSLLLLLLELEGSRFFFVFPEATRTNTHKQKYRRTLVIKQRQGEQLILIKFHQETVAARQKKVKTKTGSNLPGIVLQSAAQNVKGCYALSPMC